VSRCVSAVVGRGGKSVLPADRRLVVALLIEPGNVRTASVGIRSVCPASVSSNNSLNRVNSPNISAVASIDGV